MDKSFAMDQLVRATWDGNTRDYVAYGGELRLHVDKSVEEEELEKTEEAYLRDAWRKTILATADPDSIGVWYVDGPWNGTVDLGPCGLVYERDSWKEQMAEENRRAEMER